MNWQLNLPGLLLFFSASMSGLAAAYFWQRRKAPGASALVVLGLGACVWSLSYAVATGFQDLSARLFWAKMQYPGIVVIPPAMFAFAAQYTGHRRWLTRRAVALLAFLPAVTLLAAWTNQIHGLVWAEFSVIYQGALPVLDLVYGPLFWIFAAYSYALLVSATFLLVQATRHASHLQRRQTSIVLAGAILPWFGNFFYLTGLSPVPHLDWTPFFYSLSALVLAWGLFRYRLFDIVPVARGKVVDNMRDGVIVLDAQGRVVDINPAALRIVDCSFEGAIGQPVEQVLFRQPELAHRYRNTTEARAQIALETGGQTRHYDLLISTIYDRRDAPTGRLVLLHDITEQQQAESALRQAKEAAESASRAKSMFLANMSHELRTPLNAILGFSELMARDANLQAGQRENLETIRRSGEHLLAQINDVLELSRIEAGRLELRVESLDLHHMLLALEEMFRLRTEHKGLELICERGPGVPRYVGADGNKLRQVLINLLGNAVKFTAEGSITLRVRCAQDGDTQPPSPSAGRYACTTLQFEVEDTGVGIAPEEIAAAFDPFVQTSSGRQAGEGTGLGLPISREFVRLMGGELTVDSEVGRGSLFRFDLPVEVMDAVAVQTARPGRRVVIVDAAGRALERDPYRLLIADDLIASRKLLIEILEPLGFALQEAADGQETLKIWESWRPHLIWLDTHMPVMDGYETTRRIKDSPQGRNSVIVALTTSASEEERASALAEGCDDVLCKPFREEEVLGILARHLGLRFAYQHEAPAPAEGTGGREAIVPAEVLAALATMPGEWRARLRQATIDADYALLLELIDQAGAQEAQSGAAAALANTLRSLVRDFAYDAIRELLDRTGDEEP